MVIKNLGAYLFLLFEAKKSSIFNLIWNFRRYFLKPIYNSENK